MVEVKLGGLGMRIGGFGFHEPAEPPSSEQLAEALASLCRDLHRKFWSRALHVQMFQSTGLVQLHYLLERVQAARERRERARKSRICSAGPTR